MLKIYPEMFHSFHAQRLIIRGHESYSRQRGSREFFYMAAHMKSWKRESFQHLVDYLFLLGTKVRLLARCAGVSSLELSSLHD